MQRRPWLLSICAAGALTLAGCATGPAPVTDTAARTGSLSTLTKLINDAGLADTLRGPGPVTVFAPNDEAFKAVPQKTLDELAANKELLRSVLQYHVVSGSVPAAQVPNGKLKSLQGADLTVSRAGTFVTVEDAVVVQPDVTASNGVVHVIDRVLIPPRR
jgi:uncharacterized surface protein with fasciclin (FAS1) repeats